MARGGSGPRPRHIPLRTCVACRQGRAKRDLVRVVRTVAGDVQVDPTGKRSGRGAYLCRDASCWNQALHRGILLRALKIERIPDQDLVVLNTVAGEMAPSLESPPAAAAGETKP